MCNRLALCSLLYFKMKSITPKNASLVVRFVHSHILHLSFTLTITVFSNSSDAAFCSIAIPNILFYSQIHIGVA